MKTIRAALSYLAGILRIVCYEWLWALCRLWHRLLAWLGRMCAARKIPVRERRAARGQCVPIHDPAYKKPDPLIYSQLFLMQQGLAVTWDNPDIALFHDGNPVPSSELKKDTDYEIVARVWNNSTDAPVAMLPVVFSFLSFGIGVVSHAIGTATVNLGVKGGPNHPAFAKMKWRTPEVGHYCIQVFLDWFDDANPNNNLGQENTQVGEAHSPSDFLFLLGNRTRERQIFRFEVDSYQLPRVPFCDERKDDRRERPPPQHDRHHFPVPAGWQVEINPQTPALAPAEEKSIAVRITPPPGFAGRQVFNVNAFHQEGFAGGVTLYVTSP